jgi:hypothetical protein
MQLVSIEGKQEGSPVTLQWRERSALRVESQWCIIHCSTFSLVGKYFGWVNCIHILLWFYFISVVGKCFGWELHSYYSGFISFLLLGSVVV